MRHYEIVFIVHPDQSEQVPAMVERYKALVTGRSGQIECDGETLTELEHAFKFNDAVLRHLTIKMSKAVMTPSPMMKEEKSRSLTAAPAAEVKAEPAAAV
ncbi:MAG: 30S ribosomal protein S6 [Rhodocyclales bacterium]|nr:30S ribosomal protein S6 [Rhodocyclales bacterium]